MRDDEQAAGEAIEEILERVERGEVQIVGRLVEDQEVGVAQKSADQIEAAALAARELGDRGMLHLRGDAEAFEHHGRGQDGAAGLAQHVAALAQDVIERFFGGVEVGGFLVVIAEVDRRADDDLAGLGGGAAGEDIQQGRLAGAVGADQAEAFAAGEGVGEIPDEDVIVITGLDFAQFDDLLAESAAADGEGQLVGGGIGRALAEGFDAVDAGLLLGGAGAGAAAQPGQLLAQDRAPVVFQASLGFLAARAVGEVIGEMPFVDEDAPVGDFPDAIGHAIEEIAVVGDEEDRAGEGVEFLLEPLDGIGVEMVGGLVEDQEFGLAEEGGGHAAAQAIDLALDGGVAGVFGQAAAGELIVVDQLAERGIGEDAVQNRAPRREAGILRHQADAQVLAPGDLAGVGGLEPGENAQQGGLARAVGADDADAVALVDAEGEIGEQGFGAVAFGQIVDRDDIHAPARLSCARPAWRTIRYSIRFSALM
ncbi:MAG: hypothetical protein BWZ08_02600 [candidate division BRC1 bacterium ADurb.BinA292]|nr:MAG: hypothetical protein BWZ08_02600 [candidate division BRC1 bacterium ADurb.BinA292]